MKQTQENIESLGAIFKSEYCFKDHIYLPQGNVTIVYGRIRVYKKSAWNHKPIVMTIKSTTQEILHTSGHDNLHEAQERLNNFNLHYAFTFNRSGREYCLNNNVLFFENIENLGCSLEIVGSQKDEVISLFKKVNLEHFMGTPLPLYIIETTQKNH